MQKLNKDTNGYLYIYDPTNIYANKAGKAYQHILVMCEHLGRKLKPNECVHHIDRDKTNNKLENLQLMTLESHVRLHLQEDRNIVYEERTCPTCGKKFTVTSNSQQQFCCHDCFSKSTRKFEISKEDLLILVWSYPTTKVGQLLGISDVAVAKRCKKLGVPKPPRGYWAKVQFGLISPEIPKLT